MYHIVINLKQIWNYFWYLLYPDRCQSLCQSGGEMQDKATPLLRNVIQFDIAFFCITIHRNNCRPICLRLRDMGYCLFCLMQSPLYTFNLYYCIHECLHAHLHLLFSRFVGQGNWVTWKRKLDHILWVSFQATLFNSLSNSHTTSAFQFFLFTLLPKATGLQKVKERFWLFCRKHIPLALPGYQECKIF